LFSALNCGGASEGCRQMSVKRQYSGLPQMLLT